MKKYIFILFTFFTCVGFSNCLDQKPPTSSLNSCNELLAVDFENLLVDGFVKAKIDKRSKALMVAKRLKTAAATIVYKGNKQKVYFVLNTLLENDGESVYRLRLNGKLIGEVKNSSIYNTSIKNGTIEKHSMNQKKICVNKGDVIQVEFTNATNGYIPEGKLTATARGRWRSLELCTTK